MKTIVVSNKLKNLLSRKFLTAIVGIITGVFTIVQGNTNAGTSLIVVSIVGYLIAEGYVDAASAKATANAAAVVSTSISTATPSLTDDQVAAIVSGINASIQTLPDSASPSSTTTSEETT